MENKAQPLNTALRAMLWKYLLLPYLIVSFTVLPLAAFYGGRLVEVQQLEYSRSIGYSATNFLLHAVRELNEMNAIVSSGPNEFIQVGLDANRSKDGVFETIYFLGRDKKIMALSPADSRYIGLDMSRRSFFSNLECSSNINFSTPSSSLRTGDPAIYLTRCTDGGEYLVGELSLSALRDAVSETFRYSQGKVFIVDQTGALLAHPDFQMVEEHINVGDWQVVRNGLKQDSTTRYWRDGQFWVGSASKIQSTNWIVVTEVPMMLVYAPYVGALLVLTLLFALIFSWTARIFLRQLQLRLITPLVHLGEGADALAGGHFNMAYISTPSPFAEINGLMSNFQKMSMAILARESQLRQSEDQYRRLVEYSPDAIMLHNGPIILYANAAAVSLYAAGDAGNLVGRSIMDFIHPESRPMVELRLQKLGQYEQSLPPSEQKQFRFDDSIFDAEVTTSSVFFSGGYLAQTIVRDITQRKNEEQALRHQATHDSLTNLPNRFLFQDRLQHALAKAKRNKTLGAVMFLDLDSFKSINDAYGHGVGDQVLQYVANSLQSILREEDTIARLGGDEFVILLDQVKSPQDADYVASNILRFFSTPYQMGKMEISISFSVGISIFPEDGIDTQLLLQSADAAMYNAKMEGKRRIKFFAPYMRVQSLERVQMQSWLNHAVEQEQFSLLYQPQVDQETGEIIGVEALIRWRHPELGLIAPDRFLPIAEESGLIIPIGEWVMKTACQQARCWYDLGFPIRVAVNLSNLQFRQPDLAAFIKNTIRHFDIPPKLIELELTENIVFQDSDASFDDLYALKATGVELAMDDFGAGFSTLGYLAHIPFDRIKIDQRLIANINNPRDAAVVSGIITICLNLDLEMIAEGVENAEQLAFCRSKGCKYFQGWYYSPAVDAETITRYLEQGVPWKKVVN